MSDDCRTLIETSVDMITVGDESTHGVYSYVYQFDSDGRVKSLYETFSPGAVEWYNEQ